MPTPILRDQSRYRFPTLPACIVFLLSLTVVPSTPAAQPPIRVAVVGLVHGHVKGFLNALAKNENVTLVAVVDPHEAFFRGYADKFHLDPQIFYTDLEEMLTEQHPDAVLVYTSIADHRQIIEAAARHHISSMVEKPLATTLEDALAIRDIARRENVHVLVNYETTWYASNRELFELARQGSATAPVGKLGEVRKVVIHDGHEGPREINVEPEFLKWLTDPAQNGAGALFDFGCYGADLMTVLMRGQPPTSVTAVTQTDKPDIYPRVDDDATIILSYPKTQAVLMPSWNWSFSRKDSEVYGTNGYAITVGPDHLRVRYHGQDAESQLTAPPLPAPESNSLDYLAAVLHNHIDPEATADLSSLKTNITVMQILDAARRSAQTNTTITLSPLPN
jgi:glucose-fructose oxidoreductase